MDREYIDRAKSGDAEALEALLREARPVVARRCARLLPCPQDAEEATQDALVQVATRLDSYSGAGSFEGWINSIAANQARMTYRSMKNRAISGGATELQEVADRARTSVIAGTRIDLLEAVEALERHHPEAVEAFVLRDFAGYTYDEIAHATATKLGTVKARIHTARDFVRSKLGGADNFSASSRI